MNKEVSFPLAKLLKTKGFDLETQFYYRQWYGEIQFHIGCMFSNIREEDNLPNEEFFLAPTIAKVVMWLYEEHGIWVYADYYNENRWFGVFRTKEGLKKELFDVFNTQTEAYEDAIKHTLNNLL